MRRTSGQAQLTSRPDHLVCPVCGYGSLRGRVLLSRSADCESYRYALDGITVGTLEQIVALPDAMGKHACECGHPEMCYLPDGTFHCPACRSEVVPGRSNLCAVVSHAQEKANKEEVLRSRGGKGEQSTVNRRL
jgi:hypothetical protein